MTVEFDYVDLIRTVKVAKGYKVKEPDGEPFKWGYVFVGWQKDGVDYDLSTPGTENITLTPKWEKLGDKPLISLSYNKVYVNGLFGKKPDLYLASYNKDNVLIGLYCEKMESDGSISFEDTTLNVDGADKFVAFLCNDGKANGRKNAAVWQCACGNV